MKKVEAIIKPYLLEDVKAGLQEAGLIGMTISEIKSFSCADVPPGARRGNGKGSGGTDAHVLDFSPRLKVEIVVANDQIESAIETLKRTAFLNGNSSDFFVQDLEDVIRIRTREHGESAIRPGVL